MTPPDAQGLFDIFYDKWPKSAVLQDVAAKMVVTKLAESAVGRVSHGERRSIAGRVLASAFGKFARASVGPQQGTQCETPTPHGFSLKRPPVVLKERARSNRSLSGLWPAARSEDVRTPPTLLVPLL